MAASTVDSMADTTANPEDRAQRKRPLLKGPKEFREMRGDQLKRRSS
jgi:hypothetical protein